MAKHGGFPGGMPGMNMNNIMKQYQRMQRKLEETQEELAKKEYTGQAGGGAVKMMQLPTMRYIHGPIREMP